MPLRAFAVETPPPGARWEVSEGFCEGVIPVTGPACLVYDLYLIWTPEVAAYGECATQPMAPREPL
jgi:hypothetical protein